VFSEEKNRKKTRRQCIMKYSTAVQMLFTRTEQDITNYTISRRPQKRAISILTTTPANLNRF